MIDRKDHDGINILEMVKIVTAKALLPFAGIFLTSLPYPKRRSLFLDKLIDISDKNFIVSKNGQ